MKESIKDMGYSVKNLTKEAAAELINKLMSQEATMIKYNHEEHKYTYNDKEFISVTTVCGS